MQVSYDEVKRLFGDISDHKIVEIIDSGATIAELNEVAAYLAQETDVMGELERQLTGRASFVYTLLRRDEENWEGNR